MGKSGQDAIVEFLRAQGISDAAIAEFLKGNPISVTMEELPTPWPATVRGEKVYKDGKLQRIEPRPRGGEEQTD